MTSACNILRRIVPQAQPRMAIVLGSGWGGVTRYVTNTSGIPYDDLPGFPVCNVEGHQSTLIHGWLGSNEVVILSGRKHSYEEGRADAMKLPIMTLREWGCEVLITTNAAASLHETMAPGSLMALTDHINFAQLSPLIGERGISRFVNMTHAYDEHLRRHAQTVATGLGETLHQGVYMSFIGPHFESPAEIRMASRMGADAVGMSTATETIIARYVGMRVLGFSLLTCMGAGLSNETLSHEYTLKQAEASHERTTELFCEIVRQMKTEYLCASQAPRPTPELEVRPTLGHT